MLLLRENCILAQLYQFADVVDDRHNNFRSTAKIYFYWEFADMWIVSDSLHRTLEQLTNTNSSQKKGFI